MDKESLSKSDLKNGLNIYVNGVRNIYCSVHASRPAYRVCADRQEYLLCPDCVPKDFPELEMAVPADSPTSEKCSFGPCNARATKKCQSCNQLFCKACLIWETMCEDCVNEQFAGQGSIN